MSFLVCEGQQACIGRGVRDGLVRDRFPLRILTWRRTPFGHRLVDGVMLVYDFNGLSHGGKLDSNLAFAVVGGLANAASVGARTSGCGIGGTESVGVSVFVFQRVETGVRVAIAIIVFAGPVVVEAVLEAIKVLDLVDNALCGSALPYLSLLEIVNVYQLQDCLILQLLLLLLVLLLFMLFVDDRADIMSTKV